MSSRAKGMLLSMMAMVASFDNMDRPKETPHIPKTDEEKETENEKLMLKRGLKKFQYKGGHVWAINQKTADKKAKRNGLQK